LPRPLPEENVMLNTTFMPPPLEKTWHIGSGSTNLYGYHSCVRHYRNTLFTQYVRGGSSKEKQGGLLPPPHS
jgi:hypothetical protein